MNEQRLERLKAELKKLEEEVYRLEEDAATIKMKIRRIEQELWEELGDSE